MIKVYKINSPIFFAFILEKITCDVSIFLPHLVRINLDTPLEASNYSNIKEENHDKDLDIFSKMKGSV